MDTIRELLLNKKVVAVKGFIPDKRRKHDIPVEYILFDDGETYIEFDIDIDYQNGGSYNTATVWNIKDKWENIMNNDSYKDSTNSMFF